MTIHWLKIYNFDEKLRINLEDEKSFRELSFAPKMRVKITF